MKYDIEIDKFGNKFYYKQGTKLFHRLDGPAIEYYDGNKTWYQDGLKHRLDGPAMENTDSYYSQYYIEGKYYSKKDYWFIANKKIYILL